jgi:two-component system, sensor histidine kinase and response regulator
LMGGELKLHSALGHGTRFHFQLTLPLDGASAAAAEAPLRRAIDERQPHALRALVVDDNPLARELLARMVESLGWLPVMADSGEQALELLQADDGGYEAVFVDWQMPGLDGWQTCDRIRTGQLAGAAPVVVMVTAHGREMLAQRSEAEQALLDGFLVKPVTASMLYDAVVDAKSGAGLHGGMASALPVAERRLQGLRLLIAEDNLNNQQVARELLEDEGAIVMIANNGREAVDLIAGDDAFDVVLMDLQMPVMDGLTATRHIRSGLARTALPIIAMTANAMASDREQCLEAGMNDHVGKPFVLDALVAVLLRHAGRAPTNLGPAAQPKAVAGGGSTRVTIPDAARAAAESAQVDAEAALERMGGRVDVYARMLRSLARDLPTMVESLLAHGERGEWQDAARQAHSIKGLAATLGHARLAELGGEAESHITREHACRADDACVTYLQGAVDDAIGPLSRLADALVPPVAAPVAPPQAGAELAEEAAALKPDLDALQVLLADSDMDAMARMDALRSRGERVFADRWQRLDDAVQNLDFDTALALCTELTKDPRWSTTP